jgi:hypothetical protein
VRSITSVTQYADRRMSDPVFFDALISVNWQLSTRCMKQNGEHCIALLKTGTNVQMWLDENNTPLQDQTYESVSCLTCTNLHFINVSTGTIGKQGLR